ncbi:MAG: molybdenum cofactor biosynthesis protein MoaE [Pseudomonadota bacterium]
MKIEEVIKQMQSHPRIKEAGMILTHLGLVRSYSLDGGEVKKLRVTHDDVKAEAIRREFLKAPGIVDIVIRLNSGELSPGEPIMLCAVAGGTRDQVFPVMQELVERLKTETVVKKEEKA